jgi:hypothetical protein
VQANESLLGHIAGIFGAADDVEGDPEGALLVARHQCGKGILLARQRPSDQLRIAQRGVRGQRRNGRSQSRRQGSSTGIGPARRRRAGSGRRQRLQHGRRKQLG